jgi:hypothetical protein
MINKDAQNVNWCFKKFGYALEQALEEPIYYHITNKNDDKPDILAEPGP